jgi:anti-anti-sigma factor
VSVTGGGIPAIDVEESTLRASGVLGLEDEGRFEEALRRLEECPAGELVIDLSDVDFVSSSYVRHMARVMVDAARAGRKVVVRARARVARLLRLAGLEKLATFEATDS